MRRVVSALSFHSRYSGSPKTSIALTPLMAKTLNQLQQEISRLQKQADALKTKEAGAVIARIKEAIAHYGLTAADLGLAGKRGRKSAVAKPPRATRKAKGPKKTSRLPIKYRDDAGNAWNGHGRRPGWFLAAIAAGKTPEQLAT